MARLNTIRTKLILSYLFSAAMALTCIFVVFMSVSISFYYNFEIFTNWVNAHILPLGFIVMLVFITLMSVFFSLLTQKSIHHLKKTIQLVDDISKGNLGLQILNDRNDELGNLSMAINRMSCELKRLSDDERRWEKAKDDMVSNISHDLRTPLTSVIGYLQLIINCEESDCTDNMMQYANVAYSKSLELKSLVEQLFEFANINNQEFKLSKTKLDISELIKQVILGQMPVLQEKNLNCRSSFPDEKVYVFADPVLLARVFDNLLSNAVKYGMNGKSIDIELVKEVNWVSIKIANYGTEIAQADLPHIFDKFYCVDKSRSDSSSGTGLGLAIVKSIVEKHNGEVLVNSNNRGTTFVVRLKPISNPSEDGPTHKDVKSVVRNFQTTVED